MLPADFELSDILNSMEALSSMQNDAPYNDPYRQCLFYGHNPSFSQRRRTDIHPQKADGKAYKLPEADPVYFLHFSHSPTIYEKFRDSVLSARDLLERWKKTNFVGLYVPPG